MRLIDVKTRDIVEAKLGMRYAALSYVWGAKSETLQVLRNLPDGLPRTIEDSIQATAQLEIEYL